MRFHPAAVVFIYGFLASGDTWSNAAQYFLQAGYRANKLYAFDWNSITGSEKKNKSWHNSTAPGDPLLEPKTPYEIEFTPPDSKKGKITRMENTQPFS